MSAEPRLIEVRKNILKQNDLLARDLRERFQQANVFVASFVSSPGSGKTAFLEKTLTIFNWTELVGHLPIYGTFAVLLIWSPGSENLALWLRGLREGPLAILGQDEPSQPKLSA